MVLDLTFKKIKGGVIVSCQAEDNDPFNNPESIAKFAQAAMMGGAIGIRSEGISKIKAIKNVVPLPLIGLIKSTFEDGSVKITGSLSDFINLKNSGCDIIAIDGTFRSRDNYKNGAEFILFVKERFDCLIMADVSTYEEAVTCWQAGADCISTTLSGYTPYTINKNDTPDFDLIKQLSENINIPIFAEGRINTPDLAYKAMKNGAWSVIVGSSITRPRVITSWFVNMLKQF